MKEKIPTLEELKGKMKDIEQACYFCGKEYKVYNIVSVSRWIKDHSEIVAFICVDCMQKMAKKIGYTVPHWLKEEWMIERVTERKEQIA